MRVVGQTAFAPLMSRKTTAEKIHENLVKKLVTSININKPDPQSQHVKRKDLLRMFAGRITFSHMVPVSDE